MSLVVRVLTVKELYLILNRNHLRNLSRMLHGINTGSVHRTVTRAVYTGSNTAGICYTASNTAGICYTASNTAGSIQHGQCLPGPSNTGSINTGSINTAVCNTGSINTGSINTVPGTR